MVFFVVVFASCQIEMINCDYWHSLFTRPTILLLISLPSGHSCIKASQQASKYLCVLVICSHSKLPIHLLIAALKFVQTRLDICFIVFRLNEKKRNNNNFQPEKKTKKKKPKFQMIYTRSLCVFGGRSVKLIGYIIRIIFASKFWLRSDWN